MNIFITGANGFVGSNLCRHFLAKGWEVHGLVRPTSDRHFLEGLDVKLTLGDLCRPGEFRIPEGMDFFVHSASIVSDTAGEETCRRNIYSLAVNLAESILAGRHIPERLIYISTALTLGFDGRDISEANPGREMADFLPYNRQKRATEAFFLDQWKLHGLPVVILRPADIFGPNDRTTCARLIRGIEKGFPARAGHGRWKFGYCYIDNLCQAVERALFAENIEGKAYTVTNGVLPTWRSFFESLSAEMGKKQRILVPVWIAFSIAGVMEAARKIVPRFDPPVTYYRIKRITTETTYDISRTIADLGYAPDDRMADQVKAIVAWYRKERRNGFIK